MQFTRRSFLQTGVLAVAGMALAACGRENGEPGTASSSTVSNAERAADDTAATSASAAAAVTASSTPDSGLGTFERGSRTERGFEVDDLLRDTPAGDVHFSLHVPSSYDGSEPYALYVHCPGYEGLWFQGVGANLQENFAFVGNDYIAKMIVVSPQLDDWDDTSAEKTIALTRWMLANFHIDEKRVYLSGYSGGGETISIVLGKHPELYRRALHMSSQWDGDTDVLVKSRVPVRMNIGEGDEYYGPDPDRRTYREIRKGYRAAGLSDAQIARLLVLDVKPTSYFDGFQADSYRQHSGGAVLFSQDEEIMGWLFR